MKKNILLSALIILLTATTIHAQDNWNNQNPATKPQALAGHAMAFIGDDKVMIFGGYGISGVSDETWIYDLSDNSWTQKIQAIKPSARWEHPMAYIGDDKVLLFGGDNDGSFLGDTWIYDLSDNTWTLKNPGTSPSARSQHAMANIGGDQVLLFSGNGFGADTWVYDLSDNTWTLKTPATNPPAVSNHSMANISGDKVVLFGSNWIDNDTWVYDLSDNNWTLKSPASKPTGRQGHELATLGGDKVLLFGGMENATANFLSDTWIYDFSDDAWTLKTAASRPFALYFGMASIGNSKILSFGGWLVDNTDGTWLYTSSEVACTMTVSAGADEHLLFGYLPNQCKTKTAAVTDGTAPFSYSWTLSRALLPGETMTGANTASVTICLMDTAELCVTVTDAASCTATDCAMIFAEDVRCGSGNNQKVMICHNGNTICVDANAVPAHLAHGDYIGPCESSFAIPEVITKAKSAEPALSVYPNPGTGKFTIDLDRSIESMKDGLLRVINSNGKVVKQWSMNQQNRIQMELTIPGIYIIQYTSNDRVITRKFVVVQ